MTIVSSKQQTLVDKGADYSGLDHALQRRNIQSKEDCSKEGLEFLTMPDEVLGGFAKQSLGLVECLGKQLAQQSVCDATRVVNNLFHCLSIMPMKSNAVLIKSISPTFPNEF